MFYHVTNQKIFYFIRVQLFFKTSRHNIILSLQLNYHNAAPLNRLVSQQAAAGLWHQQQYFTKPYKCD